MTITEDQYRALVARVESGKHGKATASEIVMPPSSPPSPQRHVTGKMNTHEAYYARTELEPLLLAGEIETYYFEKIKLILSSNVVGGRNSTTYCPDFLVVFRNPRSFRWVEIKPAKKQAIREDAWVKVKIASDQFSAFEWHVVFVNMQTGTIEHKVLN